MSNPRGHTTALRKRDKEVSELEQVRSANQQSQEIGRRAHHIETLYDVSPKSLWWQASRVVSGLYRRVILKPCSLTAQGNLFKIMQQFRAWRKSRKHERTEIRNGRERRPSRSPSDVSRPKQPGRSSFVNGPRSYTPPTSPSATAVGTKERRRYGNRVVHEGPESRNTGVKVSVVCWEMSHNAMGRAHLIASTLLRKFDVEIVGTLGFPKFGNEVWEPVKDSEIAKTGFAGQHFPTFYPTMEQMAKSIEGDVILVSKPRLPSYGLGILAKQFRNRPLLLDLDDRELAFFGVNESLTLDQIATLREDPEFFSPYGRLWTRYCESIIPLADHLTVSNLELQKTYGGTVFPHVKDERTFDPALYDRDFVRAEYGFAPEDRVILFIGTPKKHKGILQVAEALEQIGNPRYKLCVIGNIGVSKLRRRLRRRSDYVRFFDNQPHSDLPANMCIGDLVCLLQDKESEVAKYQMPSKFTDALAMEIPILATDAPPLANLASRGLVELLGDTPLDQKIDEIFSVDYTTHKQRAVENRRVFLEEYSYASAAGMIERPILRLLDETPPGAEEFGRLQEVLRESFSNGRGCRKS